MSGKVPSLLLLAAFFLSFYHLGAHGRTSICSGRTIKCRTTTNCVSTRNVCRYDGHQCMDGSDEDPQICKMWMDRYSYCLTNYGKFDHNGNCYDAMEMCIHFPSAIDAKLCKMLQNGVLDLDMNLPSKGMNLTNEIVQTLVTAVNESLQSQSGSRPTQCPVLYNRVHNHCIAFFALAKIPWAEARQFCRSIHGDLIQFKDVAMYSSVLQYMREAGLTSDYWLGGRFDLDMNAWTWVGDDSPMPLGSPFWAQKYSQTCVPRPPPQSDPFHPAPDPLPGAPCYSYTQMPDNRVQGWCTAMTWENFYYMSDQECQEEYSPMCYYTYND